MARKKHEEENEFAKEAEKTGDLSHKEAMAPDEGPGTTADFPAKVDAKDMPDADVKKPELQGHRPEDYGPPKNGSSSVQRREVIGEDAPDKSKK